MTLKRFIAVALALVLLLGALPSALASGSVGSDGHTHSWKDIGRTMQPTCTDYGYRTEVCTVCQQDRQVPLSPLGHYFPNPWKTISEPTCTEAGHEMNTCVRVNRGKACGYEWWREIPALGHDWDEGVITKAPTATQDGEITYTCKNDPSHTKTEVIPATGGEEKPALTINLSALDYYTDEKKTEFKEGEVYWFHGTVTNTGNVDIEIYNSHNSRSYGWSLDRTMPSRYLLKPGETVETWDAHPFLGVVDTAKTDKVTPGTQTETLAGTITYTATVPGYRPGTDEVICSDTASCTIGVLKPEDDGPHPGLHAEWTWADDAGAGKRYEGAEVLKHAKWTNVGDCDLYVVNAEWKLSPSYPTPPAVYDFSSLSFYKLQPGQWLEFDSLSKVTIEEVEKGVKEGTCSGYAAYLDSDNILKGITSNLVPISIPLTYPDGEEPEEAKPGLEIKWEYDQFFSNDGYDGFHDSAETEPGILPPEETAYADVSIYNTGNERIKAKCFFKYGNGITHEGSFFLTLKPGKLAALWRSGSSTPVSELITPGTETEDLLGTVTLTAWLVGYDFETEEEICKSNEITRTWKVGKNAEPEDLGDSNLSGKLEVRPGYEPSDPAGYQLGEPVSTVLTVENVGPIDLETFTVSDPWDDTTFSDGPISVSGTRSYIRADITVTEDDVEKGYIEFPMITIKWTDPDTKKERTTFAGPLTVPVLKKTGLLLKKGYEDPKNGEYFAEGEQIAWTLSVTNNSKESITDVKVDDQGVTVGEYAELKPNDKENCTVPKHTVTEYEAKVVGYVLNSATATGTDYRGATKTWPSNVAKAITKKPTEPGEDPKGDPHGLLPAISIVKAEDPAGPANGSYYEANEAIKYTITVKNTGDTELKDIAVTDSLAGLTPIGTLASLAPSEEKTFDYAYTVKEEDIPYQWIYNSATVTYTFGENVKGTPRTSNTVQSRVGDDPFPPELPHLDPDKLPEGDDWCRLTLESLGENEARYTLHACAEHAEAAMAAEEAAANGDWKAAAAIWEAEVEELYELLYNAADSQLKGALIEERAVFYDYLDSFDPLTVDETVRSMRANVDSLYDLLLATADEAKTAELLAEKEKLYADIDASYGGSEGQARANTLRLKCAFLCCAMHTVPAELPSSLAGSYAQMMGGMEADKTERVFGALDGTDSEVTETYAGAALKAQNDVIDLLSSAKSYNADDVFARGQQLWTSALDNEVNPVYEAADKEQRKLIATWRISLDTLYAAEKDFLALLYEGNDETQQELLMELYKDAVIFAGIIK